MRVFSANERQLLAIIWRNGPMPRADVSRHTALAQQSVHRLLEGLCADQLLMLGEADIRGRGKPSPKIEINPAGHAAIGLSLRPDEVRYCLTDLRGERLLTGALTAAAIEREAVLAELEALLTGWQFGILQNRQLLGLGVSVQGRRMRSGEICADRRSLPGWENLPLEALFQERLGLPSFVANSGAASALAEQVFGRGAGYDCLAYLSFDHGFGAGLMMRSQMFNGNCGGSGSDIRALFTEAQQAQLPELSGLLSRATAEGAPAQSLRELLEGFEPDWPGVQDWLSEVTPQLELAIRALKAVADPGAIFFGGDAPSALRHLLVAAARGAIEAERGPSPQLLVSGVDGDAASLGAAILPLRQLIY